MRFSAPRDSVLQDTAFKPQGVLNACPARTLCYCTASTCSCWQVMASLSELAIPHLTSASIFAVTKAGSVSLFRHNVKLLCVRPPTPLALHLCYANVANDMQSL